MNAKEANDFLQRKVAELEARTSGWDHSLVDLTDQKEFQWVYLVAGIRGGPEVLKKGVEQFALVWAEPQEQPAFYLREEGGRQWVLFSQTNFKVWNEEAVKDIYGGVAQ